MRRKLFDFTAGMSLVLCLGTATLSTLSEHAAWRAGEWDVGGMRYRVEVESGEIQLLRFRPAYPLFYPPIRPIMPLRTVPIAFACLPTLWLIQKAWPFQQDELAHERRRKGQCLRCGYSLTGNTSGICPECGRPILAKEQVKTI